MENRNYVIDRLKSKTMSIDEFNFEKLQAPPISMMFTPQDIYELNSIAKSIKLSAKPEIKYQEIDKIMRRRGFVKFTAGTNRVVYRPLENNSFVVKVAYDAVGLGDNPREFSNQMLFKPFVTKVFEVTPCGTLGVFERVEPITHREEFLSVASDIFEVINNWFIGEYVLEDFGTKFFMNWAIRKGFGPVLLDFPYVYKLDGNKLYCSAPSINSPSGRCDGIIDYDAGYNFLYCTKCGVKYKAKELAQAIENNEVIVKSEGETKMKIRLTGGTKNANKTIETGEFSGMVKKTPVKPKANNFNKKVDEIEAPRGATGANETSISNETVAPSTPQKKVVYSVPYKPGNEEVVHAIPTEVAKVAEELATESKEENKKPIESPISFDDSFKETSPIDIIKKSIDDINYAISMIVDDEEKGEAIAHIGNLFKQHYNMEHVIGLYSPKLEILNRFLKNDLGNGEDDDVKFAEILQNVDDKTLILIIRALVGTRIELFPTNDGELYTEDGMINTNIYTTITKKINDGAEITASDIIFDDTPYAAFRFTAESFKKPLSELGYALVTTDNEQPSFLPDSCDSPEPDEYLHKKEVETYGEPKFYAAKVTNIKDIFENGESEKVIVLINDNGQYVTTGHQNNIVAIDVIDDRSVDSISMVSAEWLSGILNNRPSTDKCEIDLSVDGMVDTRTRSEEAATGIFPPNPTNEV